MEKTRIIDAADTYEAHNAALAEGTELLGGKFRIESQIGSGGFGITYLADDIYLDRKVVVKECFPEAFCFRFGEKVNVSSPRYETQHRKTVEMFMREARSIGKLRHPNIVGVHQVFEENETAYMVLDLINGRDLLDLIEDDQDQLSPDQIRAILVKTLDAMDVIHSNDLLHRDVSPDNILLDKWGSPTLIDFGAAREEASKKTSEVSTMLVVKDGYSPHEFYISGGIQKPCSDLYALGATVYHLISGEAPPNSQTRLASMTEQDHDPYVPLVGRFPEFDVSFLEAIDTSLRVSPKERIQSATEWLALIETETKKVDVVHIPENRNLSRSLSELISETNEHVMKAPTKVAAKPVEHNRRATDKPFQPEWVEEFNRETNESLMRQQERDRAKAEAARLIAAEQAAREAWAKAEAQKMEMLRQAAEKEEARKSRGLLTWVTRGRAN